MFVIIRLMLKIDLTSGHTPVCLFINSDEEDVRKSVSELTESRTDSASHTLKRITSGGAPLVSLAQQSNAQVYKKGFLVRKVHADQNGKRSMFPYSYMTIHTV